MIFEATKMYWKNRDEPMSLRKYIEVKHVIKGVFVSFGHTSMLKSKVVNAKEVCLD